MEGDGVEDRVFKIHVNLTVKGKDMKFDFSETDKQAKGPITDRKVCLKGEHRGAW